MTNVARVGAWFLPVSPGFGVEKHTGTSKFVAGMVSTVSSIINIVTQGDPVSEKSIS